MNIWYAKAWGNKWARSVGQRLVSLDELTLLDFGRAMVSTGRHIPFVKAYFQMYWPLMSWYKHSIILEGSELNKAPWKLPLFVSNNSTSTWVISGTISLWCLVQLRNGFENWFKKFKSPVGQVLPRWRHSPWMSGWLTTPTPLTDTRESD